MITKATPKVLTTQKNRRGVDEVTHFFGVSKTTVCNSINEIKSGYSPEPGRIRRPGGGRKRLLDSHPEWFETFNLVVGPRTAGSPQNEGVIWVSMSTPEIARNFATFSDGQIVPHGIYDVTKNVGYMTIGTSHDTSKFVCDNIERVWNGHLRNQYPGASTMVILCDGGGSNSSSHRIVKQDLMDLATRLDMNLLVMHYPPYCSKYYPINVLGKISHYHRHIILI